MKKGNIYIAGPIRGVKDYKTNFNRAAADLRRDGWELVLSPADIKGEDLRELMAEELGFLARTADAIYMLRGWEKSAGARIERDLAIYLSLRVFYEGGS